MNFVITQMHICRNYEPTTCPPGEGCLCACLKVCLHVCMYTCMHVCLYAYQQNIQRSVFRDQQLTSKVIHAHVDCIFVGIHTNTRACMYTYTHANKHSNMHTNNPLRLGTSWVRSFRQICIWVITKFIKLVQNLMF